MPSLARRYATTEENGISFSIITYEEELGDGTIYMREPSVIVRVNEESVVLLPASVMTSLTFFREYGLKSNIDLRRSLPQLEIWVQMLDDNHAQSPQSTLLAPQGISHATEDVGPQNLDELTNFHVTWGLKPSQQDKVTLFRVSFKQPWLSSQQPAFKKACLLSDIITLHSSIAMMQSYSGWVPRAMMWHGSGQRNITTSGQSWNVDLTQIL